MPAANTTNIGIIKVVAMTRVTTKYLKGLMEDTSIASICSVTFIEPNSAPMPDAILPAHINAVMTGAISLTNDSATMPGNQLSAPNSAKVGRDCKVRTTPMMKPVIATNGNDLYPTL